MSLTSLCRAALIAVALTPAACGADRSTPLPESVPTMPPATLAAISGAPSEQEASFQPQRTVAAPPVAQAGQAPDAQPAGVAPPPTSALKLVRTAQVALEVSSYEKAAEAVRSAAEAHGGYLADVRAARGTGDRRSGSITLRVPAERFASAVSAVKALGKVRSEAVSAQDVTKAYADLETRLAVKREAAQRVRDILKMRTAGLADILAAERELARLTELIEQMEGERRYYDHQIALSTITVALEEPGAAVTASVFEPIGEALHDSAAVLARSIAALVYAIVFLAPWLLVVFVVWRVIRSLRAARRRPPTLPATTSGDKPGDPA